MLRIYRLENSHLVMAQEAAEPNALASPPVWLDLYNPTPEDYRYVEQLLSLHLPTREEMQEIEVSARLYQEDGAEFMTITSVSLLESDEPITTPITFVLKGNTLVTVRYAEPKAFANFVARAQKPNAVPVANGENIMMGLIEALLDRMADALERVGTEIDVVSRLVFRKGAKDKPGPSGEDLQTAIERIGQNGDLLTKVRESLVSINRVLTYHTSMEQQDKKMTKDAKISDQGPLSRRCCSHRSGDFPVEQDQFSARCYARPDQPAAEPDHQDLLGGCGRISAADARRINLRNEFPRYSRTQLGAGLSLGPRPDGGLGSAAVYLFQAPPLALSKP